MKWMERAISTRRRNSYRAAGNREGPCDAALCGLLFDWQMQSVSFELHARNWMRSLCIRMSVLKCIQWTRTQSNIYCEMWIKPIENPLLQVLCQTGTHCLASLDYLCDRQRTRANDSMLVLLCTQRMHFGALHFVKLDDHLLSLKINWFLIDWTRWDCIVLGGPGYKLSHKSIEFWALKHWNMKLNNRHIHQTWCASCGEPAKNSILPSLCRSTVTYHFVTHKSTASICHEMPTHAPTHRISAENIVDAQYIEVFNRRECQLVDRHSLTLIFAFIPRHFVVHSSQLWQFSV